MTLQINKRKKAYTLLEVVVSMGIITILILIFFNAIVVAMQVSLRNLARSTLREEMSSVITDIVRDIRNADAISSCEGDTCQIIRGDTVISWQSCQNNKICKSTLQNGQSAIVYTSPDNLIVRTITFERGFSANNSAFQSNYLVTIIGGHSNPDFGIENIVRQTSVSTRNYEF